MKAGFTLIELMVVLLLSSIIGAVLYSSYYSTNRVAMTVNNTIDNDVRIGLIARQLQRDLAGCFIPQASEIKKKEREDSANPPPKPNGDTTTPKTTPEAPVKKPETAKKKEIPAIKDIFISTNKQNSLELLSFVSNNPLQGYVYARNIVTKPSLVRVVYRLVADTEHKNSYNLLRQEATELDLNKFDLKNGKIRPYELAHNIKNITIDFSYPKPEEEPKPENPKPGATSAPKKPAVEKPKPEKKEVSYITKQDWHFKIQQGKQEMPPVPQFIKFSIVLWDNQFLRDSKYSVYIELLSFKSLVLKEPKPEFIPTVT